MDPSSNCARPDALTPPTASADDEASARGLARVHHLRDRVCVDGTDPDALEISGGSVAPRCSTASRR